jgi:hypothetical protein
MDGTARRRFARDLRRFHQGNGRPQARHFPVVTGQFADRASRALMDELAEWVQDYYAADLVRRPSKHVYLRQLPPHIQSKMDRLRDSPLIHASILEHFDPGTVITPMKHTDELYISHYNKDRGGDEGLYGRHYDGNLRFLSVGTVVRALIYLQSDATYTVVFADSGVAKAFATYDFGILDFHRELHWVEGQYNPADRQRILLKCNYFLAPANAGWFTRAVRAANTGVFYVVKAAMEYSKSPSTPPQKAIGFMCNFFRVANNVHPLVPLVFILSAMTAAGWGFYKLVN